MCSGESVMKLGGDGQRRTYMTSKRCFFCTPPQSDDRKRSGSIWGPGASPANPVGEADANGASAQIDEDVTYRIRMRSRSAETPTWRARDER